LNLPPDQFARARGRVNVPLLASKSVVVVGVGTVGSQVANELAQNGIGRLGLIDGKNLRVENLLRHALPREYVNMNKATAMADFLCHQVPSLHVYASPHDVDGSQSDAAVDRLLSDGDLVVVATDDREAQRRIAGRSIALDIPAVLPALYGDRGGEVFVQRSARHPCFYCWDGYRPADERMRAVSAINADTFAVLQLAVHLILGILDPSSSDARLLVDQSDPRPLQLFIQRPFAALDMSPQSWRPDCPYCPLGPPSLVTSAEATAQRDANNLLEQRTSVWRWLTATLGALVFLMVVSYIVISDHISDASDLGAIMIIVFIIGLWVLYVNAAELIDAWAEYKRMVNLQRRRW